MSTNSVRSSYSRRTQLISRLQAKIGWHPFRGCHPV